MWMSLKLFFRNKNLLIAGMILSTIPVALTFFLVSETERISRIYKHTITIQSKLDDLNDHIKDWVIFSLKKEFPFREESMMTSTNNVNQDIIDLNELVEKNEIQSQRAIKINQLWKELITARVKGRARARAAILKEIDSVIDSIDNSEEQVSQEKQKSISEAIFFAKIISAISIFLGVIMTLISIFIINRNLKKERELNNKLKISETKALESSRLKASFLATVSHEIRTPLNGIIGLSDVLRKMNLKDDEYRFVELIHNSGKTLLKIINDILDYSKIESGKIELENSDFSIRDIIEQVTSTLNPKASEKAIHLDFVIDENLPKILNGDSSRISQILYNLTGNAIKFTSTGSVVIKVNLSAITEDHAAQVYFSVSDTGIGLTEEQQGKLFQPFTQLQKVGTSGEAGTGLGLSICRQILRAMNSEIFVESKKDSGSRFFFTLEFSNFSDEKIGTQVLSKKMTSLNRQIETKSIFDENEKPMILVVEDNPTNQVTIQVMLERLGAQVIIASNGAESLDLVSKTDVDLIFMDCQMPVMDGFEATSKLRQSRISTPIIAMTANSSKEDQEACKAVGMNGFISKPITIDLLTLELYRILKPEPDFLSIDVLNKLEEAIGVTGKTKVIQAFLNGFDEMIETLNSSVTENNLVTLRKLGHRYKSSAETVGARGLAYLFKRLEKISQISTASVLVSQIQLTAVQIEKKLKQHLQTKV